MGMQVTTNLASISAQRNLGSSRTEIASNLRQMASGSRITRAADDAAGLAISERFRAQIRSTQQAGRNANDGISIIQTAEGSLNEISSIIVRMRELSMQSSSDTVSDAERGFIDEEIQALKLEIDRIAQTSKFRDQKLLDGSSQAYDFQVGTHNQEGEDRISFDTQSNNATLGGLGLDHLSSREKGQARTALNDLDAAHTRVSKMRSNLGALQNRLTSTAQNLAVSEENRISSNSQIRDVDYALATSEVTRNTVLLEASTSILAQANQVPAAALKVL